MSRAVRRKVWERANGICEYCQMLQDYDPRPFHLDHILPRKHGGQTVLRNLALSCAACSLHKGSNVAGYDPDTGELTPLFHPREQLWGSHFSWRAGVVEGMTATGRATLTVLCINDAIRVHHRKLLIELGVFPPSIR